MTSLIAAFNAIVELVKMAKSLIDFIEANKTEAWFQESAKVFSNLRSAKTEQERKNAAKAIRDLLRGI